MAIRAYGSVSSMADAVGHPGYCRDRPITEVEDEIFSDAWEADANIAARALVPGGPDRVHSVADVGWDGAGWAHQ